MSVFIVSANTTFRTLYTQWSSSTCFGLCWPSSGRFYNCVHGKEYWGGGLPFVSRWMTEILNWTVMVWCYCITCCYKYASCGWVLESVTSLLRGCLYTSAGKIRSKRIIGRDCVSFNHLYSLKTSPTTLFRFSLYCQNCDLTHEPNSTVPMAVEQPRNPDNHGNPSVTKWLCPLRVTPGYLL